MAAYASFREENGLEVEIPGCMTSFPMSSISVAGCALHHDRIIFDVSVVGGELLAETAARPICPAWIARMSSRAD